MKLLNKYISVIAGGALLLTSCNDWLDKQPIDAVTPDNFLLTDADLTAYIIKQYSFGTHSGAGLGQWGNDNHTDNQVTSAYDSRWIPGQWRVSDHYGKDSDDPWYFGNLYNLNYFLDKTVPRLEEGTYYGAEGKHSIGEAYFLRAYYYFSKLKTFGDFPIIKTVLKDDKEELIAASKRYPRNEVARFILDDLDKAIDGLLTNNYTTNRITLNAAYLLKSRVALYEARWETYHAGTARVPNGPGWPGASTWPGYEYDAKAEVDFFLTECMEAAKLCADAVPLENNTHIWADGAEKMNNPYYAQFAADNMSGYPEILLWRDYNIDMGIQHSAGFYLRGGGNSGFTRQFVETFLMKDGKPIYASDLEYKGDKSIDDVRENREERLLFFMQKPGELYTDTMYDTETGTEEDRAPMLPAITGKEETRAVSGYKLRKGLSNNWSRDWNQSYEGCVIMRAAEAYLNYIEASCMKNGGESIDVTAQNYWKQIRSRAGLPEDYMVTVDATDLSQENDWAVYSGNEQVSKMLYCVRRERRCELMQEGFRMDDLKSWRSLDRLDGTWQPEGINLWDEYADLYAADGTTLVSDGSDNANVSSKDKSKYLRPYEVVGNSANLLYGKGYDWCDAHYLSPISVKHFRDASETGDVNSSIIYQNPGWPIVDGQGPVDL